MSLLCFSVSPTKKKGLFYGEHFIIVYAAGAYLKETMSGDNQLCNGKTDSMQR